MRALRFNLHNRARVIESLQVFENLSVEVSESESFGLAFTVACSGDRRCLTRSIVSCIPCNWNYAIHSMFDCDSNDYYPVLYCFEKSL